MTIHCACCGKEISYVAAWNDSLSRTKVCSKPCLEKIQKGYAALIVGREQRKIPHKVG